MGIFKNMGIFTDSDGDPAPVKIAFSIVIFLLALIVIGMVFIPRYRIYKQNLQGQANLRQQEWEKRILVEQAKAEKESAILKAEAEVERAKGVAQANKIIAEGLQGREEYLRYLWINNLESTQGQVIYVPTEAGLPILEATRNQQVDN